MVERYVAFLVAMGLVTFALYAVDKLKAINGSWRVREIVLLSFSIFGGAFGGYLAMHLVRHKTRKPKFHFVNLFGIVWQSAVLIALLVYA